MNTFIRQSDTDTEIQIYTERYKLSVTKNIVIELAQQITNSFMQC